MLIILSVLEILEIKYERFLYDPVLLQEKTGDNEENRL